MISNLYFLIASLFYSLLLLISYFGVKRNHKLDTKVYSKLIITNFVGIFIGFACFASVLYMKYIPILNFIISRFYIIYLLVWMFLFMSYVYVISNDVTEKSNKFKLYKKIIILIAIILFILTFVLPLNYVNTDGKVYSYGPAVDLFLYASEICAIFCLFCIFKNYKKANAQKYTPFFIYIVLAIVVEVIQTMYPQLLLATSMETFVTYMIYFSIEREQKGLVELDKVKTTLVEDKH